MPGVFGLREARIEQIKNISTSSFRYWSESVKYGYFDGSIPTSPIPTTRFDLSNETVSDPGKNLNPARYGAGGVSNNSYGYFGGGNNNPNGTVAGVMCTIARLDFSNEVVSDPGNNLPRARGDASTASNNSYGYFGGGLGSAGGSDEFLCTITRLDFSNETVSDPGKNLPRIFVGAGEGLTNNSYGYFSGGLFGNSSTITRLDFSNESASDPGKNLPTARDYTAKVFNDSYGYFIGGRVGQISIISTISRLDFSNETVSNPGKNLNPARYGAGGVSNNSYGYFAGGYNGASVINTITRFDFSNETVSNASKNLPTARSNQTGLSGGASILRGNKTYGYFAGGQPGSGSSSTITRLDFSNETVSDLVNKLPTGRYHLSSSGVSNNSYGYIGGGLIGTVPTILSTITRLDFSNETVSNPGKNFVTPRRIIAAVSNNSYGYFGGGLAPTVASTITRLDFSNETVSDPGKNLPTLPRSVAAGVSNNSYGYFGGGETPTVISTITRLDFSNETVSDPGKNFVADRGGSAGVSNNSYGYFAGGFTTERINTITRLDFSNETVSNPTKNLPSPRNLAAGVSNNSYGYFAGGYDGTAPISTITRLDFSNETVFNPGNNLLEGKYTAAGLTNSN